MGDYREKGPRLNSLHVGGGTAASTNAVNNPGSMIMGAANVSFGNALPRVRHREYLGPIMGGTGFRTKVYPLQPGLRGLNVWMPWCSSVANSFQQYKLHGAIFEYHSTSSNYSATSALGTVSMSTLYDAGATPLATTMAINNNEFTTISSPDQTFIHPIECATKENSIQVRYVRESNSTEAADERFEDVGIFQITTNGLVSDETVQIGELWCSYDIEFLKPKMPDFHTGSMAKFGANWNGTSMLTVAPFPQNSFPVEVSFSSSSPQIRFNLPLGYNGHYLLLVQSSNLGVVNTVSFATQIAPGGAGTDVTPVDYFINAAGATSVTYAPAASPPTTSNAIFGYVFSTIAENVAQNFLTIDLNRWIGSTPSSHVISFISLDNDIVGAFQKESLSLAKKLGFASEEDMVRALQSATMSSSSSGPLLRSVPTRDSSFVELKEDYGVDPNLNLPSLTSNK